MSDRDKIQKLLTRNVSEVIDRAHLERRLLAGEKLRVKLGIDPTSPDLHLGHAVVLRKLREFQDLGCKIILIIGDFTARIGDPTGRNAERKPLEKKEVEKNTKRFKEQASKIISFSSSENAAEISYNYEWYGAIRDNKEVEKIGRMALLETFMYEAMSRFSVQNLLERKDFKKRIKEGHSIQLNEFIYPLLQGYDSVVVKADVELGGDDQEFNLLIGRAMRWSCDKAEQDILMLPLLEGIDGVRKMSKSLGNYVALNDEPDDMFRKIMSVPDKLVEKYFMLCTDLDEKEVAGLKKELKPKELKERLGFEIVKIYHGEEGARGISEKFSDSVSAFKDRGKLPENIERIIYNESVVKLGALIIDVVFHVGRANNVLKSRGEARRLIMQGGVAVDAKRIQDPNHAIEYKDGAILRIGKRFFRLRFEK